MLRRPPRGEFSVVIDLDTLIHGLHERSIVEVDPGATTLPVETLRRLACEADLLPVVLDGHGVAVDVGAARMRGSPGFSIGAHVGSARATCGDGAAGMPSGRSSPASRTAISD